MRIAHVEDLASKPVTPPSATALSGFRLPQGQPDATWTDDELAQYGQSEMVRSSALARKSNVGRFRAGHAYSILRKRHREDGTWCQVQEKLNLPRTKVWEAVEVWERATEMGHGEKEVGNFETWTEVMVAYGVKKERPEKAAVDVDANEGQGPAIAEPVREPEPDGQSTANSTGNNQAGQKDGGNAEPVNAVPKAAPKAEKSAKKVHLDLTPCEIDAATVFVKAVGGWPRAVRVLELVQKAMGG